MSSGIWRTVAVINTYCGMENDDGTVCRYEGDTDVTIDPECSRTYWTCECGYEHEGSMHDLEQP